MSLPANHPHVAFGKTGILIVNLGTPDAPTAAALRPYLKQFLSDHRVIETSPLLWQPILRGVILNTRPRKSARAYAKIWRQDTNESPLRYYTRQQAEKLSSQFAPLPVYWAMRYGNPSIADTLQTMREDGCDRIVVCALYPQYSASTVASVYDEVFRCLMKMRWQPALRTVGAWHDHPDYIDQLAGHIKSHLAQLDWTADKIILSYHGLPQKYFDKGDPYHCHCLKTSRLLREAMGYAETDMLSTFQSRFGPAKWLEPYTDKTVEKLAQDGVKNIVVVTPGFLSDCVETLEEIDIMLRKDFIAAGGQQFSCLPCLNDSPAGIASISAILTETLGSWA